MIFFYEYPKCIITKQLIFLINKCNNTTQDDKFNNIFKKIIKIRGYLFMNIQNAL